MTYQNLDLDLAAPQKQPSCELAPAELADGVLGKPEQVRRLRLVNQTGHIHKTADAVVGTAEDHTEMDRVHRIDDAVQQRDVYRIDWAWYW